MNYIVLDMEWNQPLSPEVTVRKPVILRGEIIRIGAVRLDTFETFSCSVIPQYYRKIHSGVAKLTGLHQADLKDGLPFAEAFARFSEWCGTDFSFLTWGADDIFMLYDNLKVYGLNPAWIPVSYNIQTLFDRQITKENRIYTLSASLEKVGEAPIQAHDALNDAVGTALLCKHLDLKEGLKDYPPIRRKIKKPKKEDTSLVSEVLEKLYRTPSALLHDEAVSTFLCPTCGQTYHCKKWIPNGKDRYLSSGACACGKEYSLRLRIRRNMEGALFAARRVYAMTPDQKRVHRTRQKRRYQKRKTTRQG